MKLRWLAVGWGVLMSASLFAAQESTFNGGLFDLYMKNRREQVPNYITQDLLLLSYNLIARRVIRDMENQEIAPGVTQLIEGLSARLPHEKRDEVTQANRDYLAVLLALLSGDEQGLEGRPAQEYGLVLKAGGIAPSPLWGYPIDYSQFKPRGRYTASLELQRYFRTFRYANSVLFAVTATQATGVTPEQAERMAAQALQLVHIIDQHPALKALKAQLDQRLSRSLGPGKDLRDTDLLVVGKTQPSALAGALLAFARQQQRQPLILSGLVDVGQLEAPLTSRDALTGWRLLPASHTPESAVFQSLIFNRTGPWLDKDCQACPKPFGLGTVGGQRVKAYPSLLELMALLGSEEASRQLVARGEQRFHHYEKASEAASVLLNQAQGLQKARLDFIRAVANPTPGLNAEDRLAALEAFWTGIRYGEQLYVKQSYTPTAKGIDVARARPGAALEPATLLYKELAVLTKQQGALTANPLWQEYAEILANLIAISEKSGGLTEQEEGYLNELDKRLLVLTGGKDKPIVVDIHTHAEEGVVVEEGVGFAKPVSFSKARGARLTHFEFKQPQTQRLTDVNWAARLATGEVSEAKP